MIPILIGAALLGATMFTSWALYISLVEHPARLESGPAAGRAQFRASYRRAAPWQVAFALLACLGGAGVAALTRRWPWLAGALAVGAAVPYTLVAIMPTNHSLLAATPLADDDTRRLLNRWGRLHAARTALGALGWLTFIYALGAP